MPVPVSKSTRVPVGAVFVLALVIVATFQSWTQSNMVNFVPKYLKDMGLPATTYGNMAGLFMGGSALGNVIGGHFGDRHSKRKVAATALLIAAAPLYIMSRIGWSGWLYLLIPLAGALTGAVHSIMVVISQRLIPVRLTSSGALDASFDGDGLVSHDFGAEWSYEVAMGVAVETDGKIVIAGDLYGSISGHRDLFVARFTAGGAMDTAFGQQGLAIADFGQPGQTSDVESFGLLRQSDGRLLVGGHYAYAYQAQDIARFDSTGGGSGGVLSFRNYSSSHAETAGTVTFNVRRTGGATGAVSSNVRLGAAGGQASAGLGCDFNATLAPLNWADGDSRWPSFPGAAGGSPHGMKLAYSNSRPSDRFPRNRTRVRVADVQITCLRRRSPHALVA